MTAPDKEVLVLTAQEAGYAVVPATMDKRPKVPWKQWQTEAQTEDEYRSLGHGSVWGLVTGALYDVVVLDFDFDAGGEETLSALGLEENVTVRTPGGAHVYVAHPGHPVKNSARKYDDLPGLDVRGDGGLAWFAGRSKKGTYTPVTWPPEPLDLVDLDPALAERLMPHPGADETTRAQVAEWTGDGLGTPEAVRFLRKVSEDVQRSPEGGSNAALNKAAFSVGGLIASGQLEPEHAFQALYAAAEARGAGDIETVLNAALESGAEQPWSFTPEDDEYIPAIAYKMFSQGGVPEPVPFPVEAWPSPLDEYIHQAAEAVSAPPDYFGTALLAAFSAAVGGFVDLEITPDGWKESALVYTALVGQPGARKSPVMKMVMAPIWEAEKGLFEQAKEDADEGALWHEVDPPQIVVDDATIESLYMAMEKNPRGLLMRADELAGWVKGMGQYKGGLGRDRQTWLSIWSRDPLKVMRKTTTSHYIAKPFVSVLGGIQPEVLEEMLHGRDDGLLPRILMAGGDFVTPVLKRNVLDPALKERYAAMWNDVRDEAMIARTVQFTPAGYTAYETWVNEHYKSLGKVPPELAGAWAKMDGQCARIALILAQVLRTEVTPDVVDRAVSLVRYFMGQASGLLQGAGTGTPWEKKNASRVKTLARFLLDNPGSTRADIMAMGPEWALDSRSIDRLLEGLADMGIWHG